MTELITLPVTTWDQRITTAQQDLAIDALERGDFLSFPRLPFLLQAGESELLTPSIAGKAKNVSLDPTTGSLRGGNLNEADHKRLQSMIHRFAETSRALLRNLLPHYETGLKQARTSFRATEIAGRQISWRKDDKRLHVDSFPSSPTQGTRILRVLTNVNPHGQSRQWRLGDSFEGVASHYQSSLSGPVWGSASILRLLGVTKRRRTAYDHYMLQLHDRMKADLDYQSRSPQRACEFQAGSTWMVFTDLVSHAAMSGQYALEQTYHLPIKSMLDPSRAPLRILERLLGRTLA
ncbi:MAG: Kdo hydroxylase family protein [Phycisphaerae bacterium]|nr:Kdo hydroxylase family protein [Phycisphaerae bacterium]